MADTKVRTTVRDWKTECAQADAADALDTAQTGIRALEQGLQDQYAYVFSNGRKFVLGPKAGS